ncbi:MAG: hypothetical protein KC994_25560, partial [Candidatus Omnitrophica bacterium]|nr:hypothetical protein [Candidatus Omnitrophota bacterium]
LAKILGATVEQITEIAVSMGLPEKPEVPSRMLERGYVGLIRRNWHLLPYDQLLELLEMTPDRLNVMLREEDFLWIKLGRRKPACPPLRYEPPDAMAQNRAAEIRRLVEDEFGKSLSSESEPRFDFVRQLSEPLPEEDLETPTEKTDSFKRIVYSYVAVYGDPLMRPELDPYPDGLLQRLASVGVNGVWLHAVLRDLAPGGETFPEFGEGCETRLANLRELVKRAAGYGIRVYL